MKWVLLLLLFLSHSLFAADVKYEGGCLRKVFVTGRQVVAVAWANDNLATRTCLIPVATPEEAEAILVLEPDGTRLSKSDSEAYSVNCYSRGGTARCVDSDGMELSTSCSSRPGNVVCSSYYGPSMASAVGEIGRALVNYALRNSANSYLYNKAGKLIYSYTGSFPWNTKLAEAMKCRTGFVHSTYRHIPKENSDSCPVIH